MGLSVTSGINAIAHAAEGLYAQDSNPVMDLMAEEGIARARACAAGDPRAGPTTSRRAPMRSTARGCAAACSGNVGMALHHKLCHTLGGSFNLPHAEVHTVVLPHALAYNAEAAPRGDAAHRAGARAATSAAQGSSALARDNGAPVALKDIGMKQDDLDRAADLAAANPYWNPRPAASASAIRALLQRAFDGEPPA